MSKMVLIDSKVRILNMAHYEEDEEKMKDDIIAMRLDMLVRQSMDELETKINSLLSAERKEG